MGTFVQVESDTLRLPAAVPSLRTNFTWTFAGNVLYSGCQWGMISTLAKLGSAALVGRFALGLAITAPIFMFTNLQLRAVQATDAQSDFAFADYFTLRMLASSTALSAIAVLAIAGGYDRETAAVVLLVGLAKMFESLSDVVAGLLQKAERLDRAAISLTIRGFASLLAFATVFRACRSLTAAVAVLAIVWLSVFLLYDLRQVSKLIHSESRCFGFRWPRLRTLARFSAPLGVVMTLLSLNANIPRYLLVHALGQADLGVFASLAYLLVAINLVVNAMGQAVSSRLARMFADGDSRGFRHVLGKLLVFAAAIAVLGVPTAKVIGRPLLSFIYRPEYGRHVSLFVVMVATAGVSSIASFLGYAITAARTFQMQVPVVVVSTLATVFASAVLIPRMGGRGAAFALLVGACVQTIGCALVLHRALENMPGRG